MKPAAFTYHRARSVAGAVALLGELGDEAKLIAGGQSLVAMMNFRLARPEHLVDVARVPGLDHITRDGDTLRIGALVTHHSVEIADLGRDFAVLSRAMSWIGHLPIRTRGTVGGSLAHADATAEWCLLAVLLEASIEVEGPRGRRSIAAEDFFLGLFTTALEPDEMVVEIVFPRPAPRAALTEYADRRGDFAIVAAAVDLDTDRTVLGGVGPTPTLVRGKGGPGPLFRAQAAPAPYRDGLVTTLVGRAREEAAR